MRTNPEFIATHSDSCRADDRKVLVTAGMVQGWAPLYPHIRYEKPGDAGGAKVILATMTAGDAMSATQAGLGINGTLVMIGAAQSIQISPLVLSVRGHQRTRLGSTENGLISLLEGPDPGRYRSPNELHGGPSNEMGCSPPHLSPDRVLDRES